MKEIKQAWANKSIASLPHTHKLMFLMLIQAFLCTAIAIDISEGTNNQELVSGWFGLVYWTSYLGSVVAIVYHHFSRSYNFDLTWRAGDYRKPVSLITRQAIGLVFVALYLAVFAMTTLLDELALAFKLAGLVLNC